MMRGMEGGTAVGQDGPALTTVRIGGETTTIALTVATAATRAMTSTGIKETATPGATSLLSLS